MSLVLAVLMIGLHASEPAPAQAPSATPSIPPIDWVKDRPTWIRTASGDAVARVYPSPPRQGRAAVRCILSPTGSLQNCVVVEETPPGRGFGAAVMKLTPLFQMAPVTGSGRKVEGAEYTLRINFTFR